MGFSPVGDGIYLLLRILYTAWKMLFNFIPCMPNFSNILALTPLLGKRRSLSTMFLLSGAIFFVITFGKNVNSWPDPILRSVRLNLHSLSLAHRFPRRKIQRKLCPKKISRCAFWHIFCTQSIEEKFSIYFIFL